MVEESIVGVGVLTLEEEELTHTLYYSQWEENHTTLTAV